MVTSTYCTRLQTHSSKHTAVHVVRTPFRDMSSATHNICVVVIIIFVLRTTFTVYDTLNWKCVIPEIHQIEKLRFSGISRYKLELRCWFHLKLFQRIWVSGFSGFRRCSICSGNCHSITAVHIVRNSPLSPFWLRARHIKWRERPCAYIELHAVFPRVQSCIITLYNYVMSHNFVQLCNVSRSLHVVRTPW